MIIVPFATASLITGLIQSLGTSWGLLRHYWISGKFLITIVATILLLVHTRPIGILATAAKDLTTAIGNYRGLQLQLIGDAAAAIVLLLVATTSSVYKPWGLTAYDRRKQVQRQMSQREPSIKTDYGTRLKPDWQRRTRRPRWVYVVGIHAIAVALLFVLFHLTGGRLGIH